MKYYTICKKMSIELSVYLKKLDLKLSPCKGANV